MDLPPFNWAEFWNIALWGPLTQETVAFLKKKASGDRSGLDQIARTAAANAERPFHLEEVAPAAPKLMATGA